MIVVTVIGSVVLLALIIYGLYKVNAVWIKVVTVVVSVVLLALITYGLYKVSAI